MVNLMTNGMRSGRWTDPRWPSSNIFVRTKSSDVPLLVLVLAAVAITVERGVMSSCQAVVVLDGSGPLLDLKATGTEGLAIYYVTGA